MNAMRYHCSALGLLAALASPASAANPLSCETFRQRLNETLPTVDNGADPIRDYALAYDNAARGKRYNWTSAGLGGTLTCGADSAFQEYTVDVQFDRKGAFADEIKSITRFSGAATCALTSDPVPACRDFSRRMLQDAVSQMGKAYKAGSSAPSGLSDAVLFPGVAAELTASPSLISFVIGPGRGSSMDEARKPLVAAADPK